MKFSTVIIILLILCYVLMLFFFLHIIIKKRAIPQYSLEEAHQSIDENRMRLLSALMALVIDFPLAWLLYGYRYSLASLLIATLTMNVFLAILSLDVYKRIGLARKRIQQLTAQKEKEQRLPL